MEKMNFFINQDGPMNSFIATNATCNLSHLIITSGVLYLHQRLNNTFYD